jgi:hypothetical protein
MPQQKPDIESAVMPFKIQQLVEIIMERKQLDYQDAFGYLYSSDCYKILLNKDAKLWYMSSLGIFELLEEEKKATKIDSKRLLFCAFCLERYKIFAEFSAEETLFIFRKYGVFEYLNDGFEVLHTQGENYIVNDIDEFIKTRQK